MTEWELEELLNEAMDVDDRIVEFLRKLKEEFGLEKGTPGDGRIKRKLIREFSPVLSRQDLPQSGNPPKKEKED